MVFRMDTAYFRFGSKQDESSKHKAYATAFFPMALFSAVLTLCLLIFNQQIAAALGYADRPDYISWFAWILGLDAFTTLIYAKFRLDERPLRFLMFRVANVVFTVTFLLFFLEVLPRFFPEAKIWSDNFFGSKKDLDYAFISNLLATIFVFVLMIPEMLKIPLQFDKPLYKKMLTYAFPLVIVGVSGTINQYISTPLQKYFLNGTIDTNLGQAGIYSAAAKLAIILSLFTTAFNYASEPFFFNNAAKEDSKDIYGKVALAYTIFAGLVVLGTYFYIDLVIVLIGEGYRSGVKVVPVLLMSYLFLGLFYNFSIWYRLIDKTWWGAYNSMVASIVTLVVSIGLLPVIGYMASAWASLACFLFSAISCYRAGQKYFPISYPIREIIQYILVISILLIISWGIRWYFKGSLWTILLCNTSLMALFIGFIYAKEKKWIFAVFNR